MRSIPAEASAYFWADTVAEPSGKFAVVVVLDGEGMLDGTPTRAGNGFAVPAGLDDLNVTGDLRVLRCVAPEPAT